MDGSYSTRPASRIGARRRSRSSAPRSVGVEINPRQAVQAAADTPPPLPPQRLRDLSAFAPGSQGSADPGDDARAPDPREADPREADAQATPAPEPVLKGDTVASRVQRYRRPRRPPWVGRYEDLTV